jgi:predicted acylesterase/phospholipase RssA
MSQANRPLPSQPRDGIALALSGGGYRAMLFHTGALIRLNELGLLKQLTRVSSVSAARYPPAFSVSFGSV